MSRKVRRVRYEIDSKGIESLPLDEIKAILRGADDLIMRGGRSLLAKVLKGSRAQDVLKFGLDYRKVRARIRQVIQHLKQSAAQHGVAADSLSRGTR